MYRVTLAAVFFLLVLPVYAADESGVVTFHGDASTYYPGVGNFKEGGGEVATGGRYDPNTWTAALFLEYAKQYGCGYGSKKTCYAVVQEPGGRTIIVLINDNGPLCADPDSRCPKYQRVIDLNEKSMRYLSYGKSGNGSGIIKNVTVTLLSGSHYTPGPIDENDRAQWDRYMFEAPAHLNQNNPNGGISTYPGVTTQPYMGNGNQLPQPQMTNQLQRPVSVTSGQQTGSQPVSTLLQDTPVGGSGGNLSSAIAPQTTDIGTNGPSASMLLLQKKDIKRGDPFVVSWAAVGGVNSCHVFVDGRDGDISQSRSGTKTTNSASLSAGTYSVMFRCTKNGTSDILEKSESLLVR